MPKKQSGKVQRALSIVPMCPHDITDGAKHMSLPHGLRVSQYAAAANAIDAIPKAVYLVMK
jgi:hypothetical protein